jgi:hypothetical protein
LRLFIVAVLIAIILLGLNIIETNATNSDPMIINERPDNTPDLTEYIQDKASYSAGVTVRCNVIIE